MPVTRIGRFGRLVGVGRRVLMDRPLRLPLDRAGFIHRIADHVDDASQQAGADRHGNRPAGVAHLLAADQSFTGVHGHGAHRIFAKLLGDFEDQAVALVGGLERVQNRRQILVEVHVDDGADDLGDMSD